MRFSLMKRSRTDSDMASNVTLPDWMAHAVIDAMERAAISGLCREGQLEIGAQTVRELEPGLGVRESFALASAIDKSRHSND